MDNLYKVFSDLIPREKPFVSLTGGGGKTTFMVCFARYLRSQGKKVLITTTTRIMSPYVHDYDADFIFSDDSVLSFRPSSPCTVLYALENKETNKWFCPPIENLRALRDTYDVILNEADGPKRLPVKVHTRRDPVVPEFCNYTIAFMGLWAIGKRISDVVFGDGGEGLVDEKYLQSYIKNPQGLLKGTIAESRAVILNGADIYSDTSVLKRLCFPSDLFICTASEEKGILSERLN